MADEELEAQVEVAPLRAGFWERFLAFVVDLIIVRFMTLAAGFAAMYAGLVEGPGALSLLLLVVFVAYHAAWKGASPGKRLLGLRAVDAEGEPLSLAQGFKRALGYLLGIVALGGGFLWALFDAEKRALHDKLAGTRVILLEPRSALGKAVVYGASAAIIAFNAFIFAYQRVAKPELDKAAIVADARNSLDVLATLQERHKAKAGTYTDDIAVLAGMAENPDGLMLALPKVFEGGKVAITLSGGGYTLDAKARDPAQTPVSLQGPKGRY